MSKLLINNHLSIRFLMPTVEECLHKLGGVAVAKKLFVYYTTTARAFVTLCCNNNYTMYYRQKQVIPPKHLKEPTYSIVCKAAQKAHLSTDASGGF